MYFHFKRNIYGSYTQNTGVFKVQQTSVSLMFADGQKDLIDNYRKRIIFMISFARTAGNCSF